MPPCLCRLFARIPHGRPLRDAEISANSIAIGGYPITVSTVRYVSGLTSWDTVDLATMRRFLVGCGIDFENRAQMKRVDQYRRTKPKWTYLRRSPDWKTLYEPLLRTYITRAAAPA